VKTTGFTSDMKGSESMRLASWEAFIAVHPQRVLVLGNGGSGKSTLAQELSLRLKLPIVHLDRIFWLPGWQSVSPELFDERLREEINRETWIIDGNYTRTLELRLSRSQAVVFMDMPRMVCLAGVLARYFSFRGRTRPDLTPGCPEKVDWEFLRWIWNFNRSHRAAYLERFASLDQPVVILRSRKAAARFLSGLENAA
jgi:adenylate kinase family enzyme